MKYNIYILGAGKVGTTIAKAIQSVTFHVLHMYRRSISFDTEFNTYLPHTTLWHELNPKSFEESDIVLICVPDDVIEKTVHTLSRLAINWTNKTCIHTSGIHSSSILKPLNNLGCFIASMHPMQSFNTYFADPDIFHDIIITCEGSSEATSICRKMTQVISAQYKDISDNQKIPYHLAGTFAANFTIGLVDIAVQMFTACGFSSTDALNSVDQLMTQQFHHYQKSGFSALTGPLKRGDIETIKKHLNYIDGQYPDLSAIYRDFANYLLTNIAEHNLELTSKLRELLK